MKLILGLIAGLTIARRCETAAYSSILDAVSADDFAGVIEMARSGGHDVNVPNEYQETALHMVSAPHRSHVQALRALIDAGANLDVQDVDGCTPLIWAVHNNHYENVQILLAAGANWKNIFDVKGRTAREHSMSTKMGLLFGDGEVAQIPDVKDFEQEVEESNVDVCLFVYSTLCGYCREFAPIFQNIRATLRSTSIEFKQLDFSSNPPPSEWFAISSTPAVLLQKTGEMYPLLYDGPQTAMGVARWLQTHATHRFIWTQGDEEVSIDDALQRDDAAPHSGESVNNNLHEEL